MRASTFEKKLKWPKNGLLWPTKFPLHYPPPRAPRSVQQWDSWVNAMKLDLRLSSVEKLILITIALHYNLKDGRCDPAHGRVAVEAGLGSGETGAKAVQRAVTRAERLGWMERTCRRGGPREKNQTNLYELTLPKSIQDVLNNVGPRLRVTGTRGAWNVSQTTDGVA